MTAESIAKTLGGRKAGGGWAARRHAHDDREQEPTRATNRRDWPAERVWAFRDELSPEYSEVEPSRPKGQGSGS